MKMAVRFRERVDREFEELGVVSEGKVVSQEVEWFTEWVEKEKGAFNAPDFNDDDELVNKYDGPKKFAFYTEVEDTEENEEDKSTWEISKAPNILKEQTMRSNKQFKDIQNNILSCYDNTVWWAYDEDDPDLSKSPDLWGGDKPDEEGDKWIEAAINDLDTFHTEYSGTPQLSPINVQRIFRRAHRNNNMNVEDLTQNFMDTFPSMDRSQALNIVRTEMGAVLDTSREMLHEAEKEEKEEDEEDAKYIWDGPNDDSTTDICSAVGERTKDRNGVTLDKLRSMLKKEARKFDWGTPDRVDDWVPHYQCRRTFKRVN